jgi:hypothetical protein
MSQGVFRRKDRKRFYQRDARKGAGRQGRALRVAVIEPFGERNRVDSLALWGLNAVASGAGAETRDLGLPGGSQGGAGVGIWENRQLRFRPAGQACRQDLDRLC